jgi:hypothetical protein
MGNFVISTHMQDLVIVELNEYMCMCICADIHTSIHTYILYIAKHIK